MGLINERIKARRLQLGLTLLEVAEYLGVKEATAQRYESGTIKSISHETICGLAELLKCSPSYLMGWDEKGVSLSDQDERLLSNYHKLNASGKDYIEDQMAFALSQSKFTEGAAKKEA